MGIHRATQDLHVKILQQDATSQCGWRAPGCKQAVQFHCFIAQNVPKMCTHKTYILKTKICLWPSSAFSILRSSAHQLRSPIMDIDSCGLLFNPWMACLLQAGREINADDSIFSQELPRSQTCQKAIYTVQSENKVAVAFSNTV